jgi:hypothetical protein
MSWYIETDLELTAAGSLREATGPESIRQDLAHMIDELNDLGESSTGALIDIIRSNALQLLVAHPNVTTVDSLTVTPGDNNTLSVSVYVNGNAAGIVVKGN